MKKQERSSLKPRPPIVAVLGHIDHGKTTLLSAIKEQDLTKKEFGGITQHIGAYQIKVKTPGSRLKTITFIDTPGHVAFAKMRSRGAKVADLVVLVIAADDGVMPQTRESLKHIEAAGIPFLVAVNKIDLPQANPQKVKKQLAEEGVLVEGWGGDIVCVEISAKEKRGLDDLLEMILLMAEMEELKADPEGELEAVVIESRLDKRKGPVATLLVKNGSLKIGDSIRAEKIFCKVKAMFDERGRQVLLAGPSKPVEVLGFKKLPPIGAKVEKVERKLITTEDTELRKEIIDTTEDTKKFKIILKSDVEGTLEAIKESLPKEVYLLSSGVGEVTESDVLLAATTGALIFAFNVDIPLEVKKLAQTEKVKIKTHNIIYKLLEDVQEEVLEILEPKIEEKILGKAEIIAQFETKDGRIAGCRVLKGKISKEDELHLQRGEKILGDVKIVSMRHKKKDINQAKEGEEFGVIFTPPLDFKMGDMLISYCKK